MSRPVVGVTASLEAMTSGDWTELTAGVPASYVAAVQRAGGRAVLLPPDAEAADALEGVDALLITGAAGDTDPAAYGAELHPKTQPVRPDVVGHDDHTGTPGVFAEHDVRLDHGSLAARAVGAETMRVKSYHHQGVANVALGLRATARASRDGLVEAIEADDGFVLGVLWHPEEDEDAQVIGALVRAASRTRR